jgi:hypothetical protein
MVSENILNYLQYSLSRLDKENLLIPILKDRHSFHINHCGEYRNIIHSIGAENSITSFNSMPFLPVRLFKELELRSIIKEDVFKTLTSSGTTSQTVSKIYLDKETAVMQTKALASIITSFVGGQRLPMIIVDSKNILKNKQEFNARGAGIIGLSNFGRDHLYILDENMELDFDSLNAFLQKHKETPILLFGFTFMVWQYFISKLQTLNRTCSINNGILIHSGGWKKLIDLSISNDKFKSIVNELTGIKRVYNFYGMVEQVGTVYMECDKGFFHSSNFSEIIIRSPLDWSICRTGEEGLVQTISILPASYPGNSILTEDIGVIHGVDDCKCGRKGTYFTIKGRLPKSELRGCSDTHAYSN